MSLANPKLKFHLTILVATLAFSFLSAESINVYKPAHFIVFDEIGKMASSMSYVHVLVPLNISNLYDQAELFRDYLIRLAESKTSDVRMVPHTKSIRDVALVMQKRLTRTMLRLAHLNDVLPTLDTLLKTKRHALDYASLVALSVRNQKFMDNRIPSEYNF